MADSPQDQGADPIQPTGPEIITEPADDDVLASQGIASDAEGDERPPAGEPTGKTVAITPPPMSDQDRAIAEQVGKVEAALRPDAESYAPYDPSALPRPLQVSEGSGDPSDAHRGEAFDARYREDFEGLLFLGSLAKTFTWMEHEFQIKTIGTDEALAISLVIQPWAQTQGEVKAYQAAAVAAALVTVDGKELPQPLTRDITPERLKPRFEWVLRNYQPVVIDMIYGQVIELENKVVEILAQMGKASG